MFVQQYSAKHGNHELENLSFRDLNLEKREIDAVIAHLVEYAPRKAALQVGDQGNRPPELSK
jgi:hypothetical protein